MGENIRNIHRGRILTLNIEDIVLPNGNACSLEVVHHPGAVAVVPVLDDGRIVLVRQYRHAAGGYLIEIPAGKLDVKGESPEACAARELEEEIGYRAKRFERITTIYTSPGFCDEKIHLFLATGLEKTATSHEPDEVMTCVFHTADDVMEMIGHGDITDAKSIVALTLAIGQKSVTTHFPSRR